MTWGGTTACEMRAHKAGRTQSRGPPPQTPHQGGERGEESAGRVGQGTESKRDERERERERERGRERAERVGSGRNDKLAKLDNGERKRVGNKVPEKGRQAEHTEKHTG